MSQIEFYNRFHKMTTLLHSFAYTLTKNIEDAKDLYQETAFRAMTNKEKFRVTTLLWCPKKLSHCHSRSFFFSGSLSNDFSATNWLIYWDFIVAFLLQTEPIQYFFLSPTFTHSKYNNAGRGDT